MGIHFWSCRAICHYEPSNNYPNKSLNKTLPYWNDYWVNRSKWCSEQSGCYFVQNMHMVLKLLEIILSNQDMKFSFCINFFHVLILLGLVRKESIQIWLILLKNNWESSVQRSKNVNVTLWKKFSLTYCWYSFVIVNSITLCLGGHFTFWLSGICEINSKNFFGYQVLELKSVCSSIGFHERTRSA